MSYNYFERLTRSNLTSDEKVEATIQNCIRFNKREITFFTGLSHSVQKIEIIEEFAELFGKRVEQFHKNGIKVGINHHATIGYFNQGIDLMYKEAPFIVQINGEVNIGALCPSADETLDYVRKVYTIDAKTNPDFIYIDDDIRFNNDGYCYCDRCIGKFENMFHVFGDTPVTRENLLELLKDRAVREKWIKFNGLVAEKIYKTASDTVYEINPNIEMGFMVYTGPFTKNEIERWAAAVKGKRDTVRIRPGGGLYDDLAPMDVLNKAASIAKQNLDLPCYVDKIQSEIECFPKQGLAKSNRFLSAECLLYLACGCNGVSFNSTPFFSSSEQSYYDEYAGRQNISQKIESFGTEMVNRLEHSRYCGAYFYMGDSNDIDRKWYRTVPETPASLTSGLPFAFSPEDASVNVLTGEAVSVLSDESLKRAFDKPVFMSGDALKILNNRGFEDYTGAKIVREYATDTKELGLDNVIDGVRFPEDALWRDSIQAFSWMPGYSKSYTVESENMVKEMTKITDYSGNVIGTGMLQTVNKFGQRIVVSGYAAWTYLNSFGRRQQVHEAFHYLTGGISRIMSCHKIALIEKHRGSEKTYVLFNASLDNADNIKVFVPYKFKNNILFSYYDDGKTVRDVTILEETDDGTVINIKNLPYMSVGYFSV